MQIQSPPLITIKEARKYLGKASENLGDSEIEELIFDLSMLARKFLTTTEVPKSMQVLNTKPNTENIGL